MIVHRTDGMYEGMDGWMDEDARLAFLDDWVVTGEEWKNWLADIVYRGSGVLSVIPDTSVVLQLWSLWRMHI